MSSSKIVLHANFWTDFLGGIKLSHVRIPKTVLNFVLHCLERWIQAMRKCSGAWTRWSRKIRHWELRFLSVAGHLAQKHRTLDLWFQQHKIDPHSSHRQLPLSGNTVSMESTSIGSIQMVKSKGISSAHFSGKFCKIRVNITEAKAKFPLISIIRLIRYILPNIYFIA